MLHTMLHTMIGKVCVVTGANSGIGYHSALHLAKAGADVSIICRNEEKGKEAVQKIAQKRLAHMQFNSYKIR